MVPCRGKKGSGTELGVCLVPVGVMIDVVSEEAQKVCHP